MSLIHDIRLFLQRWQNILFLIFLFCLLSPNLDVNDEFVGSRSSYSLKNGKTVREPPMMESLYIEITSFSHVHHVCFPINVTKFLSILTHKIYWRPLIFESGNVWFNGILHHARETKKTNMDFHTS